MMKSFDYDSLSDIEQYHNFDLKSKKSSFYEVYRANHKKVIIHMCHLK